VPDHRHSAQADGEEGDRERPRCPVPESAPHPRGSLAPGARTSGVHIDSAYGRRGALSSYHNGVLGRSRHTWEPLPRRLLGVTTGHGHVHSVLHRSAANRAARTGGRVAMAGRVVLALAAIVAAFAVTGAGTHQPETAGPGTPAAARAVAVLTGLADGDLTTALPADFREVMGYEPTAVTSAGGARMYLKPAGDCSSPFGPTTF